MLGIEGSTFTVDGIDRGTYPNGGKSLVLDGSADYLSRTFSASNRDTWTFSIWVKRSGLSSQQGLLIAGADNSNVTSFVFESSNKLVYYHQDAAAVTDQLSTNAVFRDTNKFYHVVLAVDTTQATEANRIKVYVDGIEQTFSTANYPTQNTDTDVNSAVSHRIGASILPAAYQNGYISKIDFIDGQQLTPSSFGHESTDTGKWVASNTSGLTFGTNGFSLDFNDDRSTTPDTTTTIYDQSSNSNNWTGNSLVAGSFTGDTPVDNYATLNPLHHFRGGTLSNGNLTHTQGGASFVEQYSTIPIPNSGKWGFQYTVVGTVSGSNTSEVGVCTYESDTGTTAFNPGFKISAQDGKVYLDNVLNGTLTGAALVDTDVVEILLDVDNNQALIKVNGTLEYTLSSITCTSGAYTMLVKVAAYAIASTFDFGQTGYTPSDSTYLPLSSANLPVADVLYRKPQNFADILLYTGNGTAIGSGGNAVTGAAFQPDLTWIKNRDAADSHQWTDIVRGVTKNLSSDSTAVEGTDTEGLTSFTSGGFTVGSDVSYNTNTEDYWAMCLKADNTSGASNTDGTETTTVSAGDFFSIVTYTGTAAVDTFGHGLGKTPDLILIKHRSGTFGWMVYHSSNTSAPETDYLQLNTTAATADLAGFLNDTAPTSSVFTLGTNTTANTSGGTYVAYCFVFDTTDANSPFTGGSYTGNGSADGTFIPSDEVLTFLIKRTDATANWQLVDQLRNVDTDGVVNDGVDVARLIPDTNDVENAASVVIFDFLSNGIKLRGTTTVMNASGGSYVWFGIKKNGGQLWS